MCWKVSFHPRINIPKLVLRSDSLTRVFFKILWEDDVVCMCVFCLCMCLCSLLQTGSFHVMFLYVDNFVCNWLHAHFGEHLMLYQSITLIRLFKVTLNIERLTVSVVFSLQRPCTCLGAGTAHRTWLTSGLTAFRRTSGPASPETLRKRCVRSEIFWHFVKIQVCIAEGQQDVPNMFDTFYEWKVVGV